jgi:hypothetical protein
VNSVLEYLSQNIQNVGVDSNLFHTVRPEQLLEIQSAALYLTAEMMNCLAVVVGYVMEPSNNFPNPADCVAIQKAFLISPDLLGAKDGVRDKARSYTDAIIKISGSLLAAAARKQQEQDIFKWIWPSPYSPPKTPAEDNVGISGEWFWMSSQYKEWVGDGHATLICSGQRITHHCHLAHASLAGAGKSQLLFLPS